MEIREDRLLEKLARFGPKKEEVLRGIGDDGAVVQITNGEYVFTQDALVEHIHFELSLQSYTALGKKAVYVNVSDVLAMGALPLYFLVTIAVPPSVRGRDIEDLYRGIDAAAREFNIALIGGDTTASREDLFLDISMTGRGINTGFLTRNGARPGDLIAVTGWLGEAAYGLSLLKSGKKAPNRFTRRYTLPRPPLEIWRPLVETEIPHALMDVSDGLLIDLGRMMRASGTSAMVRMEHVPVPSALKRAGMEQLAFNGGEDYQFLFTFARERMEGVHLIERQADIDTFARREATLPLPHLEVGPVADTLLADLTIDIQLAPLRPA